MFVVIVMWAWPFKEFKQLNFTDMRVVFHAILTFPKSQFLKMLLNENDGFVLKV